MQRAIQYNATNCITMRQNPIAIVPDCPLPPINSCTLRHGTLLTNAQSWIDQIENWLELNLQIEQNWANQVYYNI